jgi:hypothetical protein
LPVTRAVARQRQLARPGERGLRLHGVLRHVDEHRPGTAGGGDVERLGDRARDLGGVGDQEVVLGDRHRDAADVRLLEGVGADRRAGDLAGDGDHRDGVHVGVGERGDQVGGARAAGGHADADLAGGGGVPLRRVPGALLVTDQDVPDPHRVVERVVGREDRAAGDAEDVLGAGALQRGDQALGARHRSRAHVFAHHGLPVVLGGAIRCPRTPQCRMKKPLGPAGRRGATRMREAHLTQTRPRRTRSWIRTPLRSPVRSPQVNPPRYPSRLVRPSSHGAPWQADPPVSRRRRRGRPTGRPWRTCRGRPWCTSARSASSPRAGR